MPDDLATSPRVFARIPHWIWGGNPHEFARRSHLRLTAAPDTEHADKWQIQTVEQYERTGPGLIRLSLIAAPGSSPRLEALDRMSGDFTYQPVDPQTASARADAIIEKRPGQLAATASAVLIKTLTAPVGTVGPTVAAAHRLLLEIPGDDGRPLFPNARVHLVRTETALTNRCAFARLLLRAQAEPHLYAAQPTRWEDGELFASARGLHVGLYLFDPYLVPMLLAHSPYVWGFCVARTGGVVIYDLGRCVNGTVGEATELLQILGPPGVATAPPRPQISEPEIDAALAWWVSHLDRLLGTVTDPVLYRTATGSYSPQAHLHLLLTVEQLFRHVQCILTQPRDTHARRESFFGFLDAIEKVTGSNLIRACTVSEAEATLSRLEASISSDAAMMLLPACRRAVAALRTVQDGFFSRNGADGDMIRLPSRTGSEDRSLAWASAHYLHVLRNATHGFGGRDDARRLRNEVLLASHTGRLPDDLPLLAYLYLLDLMTNVENLRRALAARQHA